MLLPRQKISMTMTAPPNSKLPHHIVFATIGFTLSLAAARADLIINRFDSAAEVAAWRYDGGLPGGSFTFDPTQDAGGSSSRGAMKLVLPFTAPGGFEFTLDKFSTATNLFAAGFTNLSLDVKVDPSSPTRADGNAGWFQLVIRADDNHYSFLRQYGGNLNTNDGWFHISVPLAGDVTATRGFSFQFSDSDLTNGTRVAWIDNLVLQGGGPVQNSVAGESVAPVAPPASAWSKPGTDMLVNGNFADGTNRWVLEQTDGATGRMECVPEGPEGQAALRIQVLTTASKAYHLQLYQTGPHIHQGRTYELTFWAKSDRASGIKVNCMMNHEPWEHHTQELLPLSTEWKELHFKFATPWSDNNVRISFTDLGATVGQTYWLAKCSLVPVSETSTSAATTPSTDGPATQRMPFVWKGDCSSESAFVHSQHATIPGHYEYLPDPREPARGTVFIGHLTPDFQTADPEKFHLHPEIYFDHFIPGNISISFDVKVDDLSPSGLGPYGTNPWLNVVTLFDETTVAGGTFFHPSVMVNLVGTPGNYRLQAYSMDAHGAGTFYEKMVGGPVFPTGKWVTVRVVTDVKANQVQVYQDNVLASAGPYLGKPGLAGAHMGLYANRKMTRATVSNSNINIKVGD